MLRVFVAIVAGALLWGLDWAARAMVGAWERHNNLED